MGRRRIAVGVAVGLVGGAFAALSLVHPQLGPRVSTATPDQLARSGVLLFNPLPWDSANVIKAQAEAVAVSPEAPGTTAAEAVLAEVVKTNPNAEPPRLCWVVILPGSAAPSAGPEGSGPIQGAYYLAFVDARSGAYLWAVAGR
jgi:hypothetical protein